MSSTLSQNVSPCPNQKSESKRPWGLPVDMPTCPLRKKTGQAVTSFALQYPLYKYPSVHRNVSISLMSSNPRWAACNRQLSFSTFTLIPYSWQKNLLPLYAGHTRCSTPDLHLLMYNDRQAAILQISDRNMHQHPGHAPLLARRCGPGGYLLIFGLACLPLRKRLFIIGHMVCGTIYGTSKMRAVIFIHSHDWP